MSFHQQPLTNCVRPGVYVRGNRLYFPIEGVGVWAQIIDAGAQVTGKTASVIAGEAQKAERAAKRSVQGKALELEAERLLTGAARTTSQAGGEAARLTAAAAVRATEMKTKYIIAGAAGLGVMALLALVVLR